VRACSAPLPHHCRQCVTLARADNPFTPNEHRLYTLLAGGARFLVVCQADRALIATVSKTKELKRRYGAKRELFCQFWNPSLPCERLSLQPLIAKLLGGRCTRRTGMIVSPIVMEVFTLTFLAEWGDRSQLATIGLAASTNVVGALHATRSTEPLLRSTRSRTRNSRTWSFPLRHVQLRRAESWVGVLS